MEKIVEALEKKVAAQDEEIKALKADIASLKSAGEEKPAEETSAPKVVEIKHGKKVYEAPAHLRLSYRDKEGATHKVTAADLAKDEKLAAKFVGKIKSITEKKS